MRWTPDDHLSQSSQLHLLNRLAFANRNNRAIEGAHGAHNLAPMAMAWPCYALACLTTHQRILVELEWRAAAAFVVAHTETRCCQHGAVCAPREMSLQLPAVRELCRSGTRCCFVCVMKGSNSPFTSLISNLYYTLPPCGLAVISTKMPGSTHGASSKSVGGHIGRAIVTSKHRRLDVKV